MNKKGLYFLVLLVIVFSIVYALTETEQKIINLTEKKQRGALGSYLEDLKNLLQEAKKEKEFDINAKNERGINALRYAVTVFYYPANPSANEIHTDAVKILLEHGADPNVKGADGMPLLFLAIKNERPINKIVELLVEDPRTNIHATWKGMTAADYALEERKFEIAEFLENKGVEYKQRYINQLNNNLLELTQSLHTLQQNISG